jgi:hypothetical protein
MHVDPQQSCDCLTWEEHLSHPPVSLEAAASGRTQRRPDCRAGARSFPRRDAGRPAAASCEWAQR